MKAALDLARRRVARRRLRDAERFIRSRARNVAERTGKRVHWNRGGPEDAQIEQGVQGFCGAS